MRRFIATLLIVAITLPVPSFAGTHEELMQKIQELTRQLEELKKQVEEQKIQEKFQEKRLSAVEEKAETVEKKWSWLTIGGDYRFRIDSLKGKVHDYMQYNATANYGPVPSPYGNMYFRSTSVSGYTAKNDSIMFNRFRLKLNARVTENIELRSRLVMYKTWGHETTNPVTGSFFADRTSVFDGSIGHVPQDNTLRVDYAYATWTNIFDTPIWFSIGRRASVEGIPTTVRQNTAKIGTAGVAGLLIDYSFDGLTLGVAPYIEQLPGFYAKVCYGRGYDSGFRTDQAGYSYTEDTDFVGIFVDPIYTDNLNIELNYVRGMNIFSGFPDSMTSTTSSTSTNLGDIDLYGANLIGKIEDVGPGDLNFFISGAISRTHPNDNLYSLPFYWIDADGDGAQDAGETDQVGSYGLLYDGGNKKSHTGNAIYIGARYDFKKTGTKIGLEYNRGSKYWLTFTPAADDLWTSKLGTRGSVYEAYIIQELPETPIAKLGKAFFRLGYQYYKFKYTGSNNWIGEPKKIDDLNTTNPMLTQVLAPLKSAHDIYLTFDVAF